MSDGSANDGFSADTARTDVLIVGAGVAGLTAARLLTKADVSCLVLEARDRVGGRTCSQRLGGDWIDLGGQWIGPTQDRIAALAGELGVETFPQFCTGTKVVDRRGEVHRVPAFQAAFNLPAQLEVSRVLKHLDRLRREVPPERPHQAPGALKWDSMTAHSWFHQNLWTDGARDFLEVVFRAIFACEPSDASFLFFLTYLNSGNGLYRLMDVANGAQRDRFIGGAQEVSNRMAAALGDHVRLNAPVRAIVQETDGATVLCDKRRFRAQRVIVAIPPTLAGRIDYQPHLPAKRDQLMQNMPMGSIIKYVAAYAEPFWRQQGYSGEAVSDRGCVGLVLDDSSHDGAQAALVAFSDGRQAQIWSECTPEERRQAVLSDLSRFFGPEAASPTAFVEKNWLEEEWSRGCYVAHMGPGVMTSVGDVIREPCGRIHWAGTETATQWMGYIDGAVESGQRVAAEVQARLASAVPADAPAVT